VDLQVFYDYLFSKAAEFDQKIVEDLRPLEFEYHAWHGDWWECRESVRRLSEGVHYKESEPPPQAPNPWMEQIEWPKETENHGWVHGSGTTTQMTGKPFDPS
jgi:hypothetical protein